MMGSPGSEEFDDMLSRLDTIHQRDRHTESQSTDTDSKGRAMHSFAR